MNQKKLQRLLNSTRCQLYILCHPLCVRLKGVFRLSYNRQGPRTNILGCFCELRFKHDKLKIGLYAVRVVFGGGMEVCAFIVILCRSSNIHLFFSCPQSQESSRYVGSTYLARLLLGSSATHCHCCQVGLIGVIEVTSRWRADLATLLSGSFRMAVLQVTLIKILTLAK